MPSIIAVQDGLREVFVLHSLLVAPLQGHHAQYEIRVLSAHREGVLRQAHEALTAPVLVIATDLPKHLSTQRNAAAGPSSELVLRHLGTLEHASKPYGLPRCHS